MLFDMISAIELAASAAVVAAWLSFNLSQNPDGRLRAAAALGLWFLLVIILGATNALGAERAGPIGLAVAVTAPIAALCYLFFAVAGARAAIMATPIWAMIALNVIRALGVAFVILYAQDRLPAPFAPSAGFGDIFVGVTAIPLALFASRSGPRANRLILAWNIVGFLDLVFAVGFGATSSPGPIQVFVGPPTSQIMTTLPWLIIPGFLVPIFQALHIVIFYRLRKEASIARATSPKSFSAAAA
jgi:hypothetical protein